MLAVKQNVFSDIKKITIIMIIATCTNPGQTEFPVRSMYLIEQEKPMKTINRSNGGYILLALVSIAFGAVATFFLLNSYNDSLARAKYASNVAIAANKYVVILNSTIDKDIDIKEYLICVLEDEYKNIRREKKEIERISSDYLFKQPFGDVINKLDQDLASIQAFKDQTNIGRCTIPSW